jgi:dipeptide/tripeptide permease
MVSAMWCLGYVYAPEYIDWWKMWEMSAGFSLGSLYALLMYWAIGRMNVAHSPNGKPLSVPSIRTPRGEWRATVWWALSGALLIFAAGAEYFPLTAILLGLLYAAGLWRAAVGNGESDRAERIHDNRATVTLIFAVFLLLFILFRGASSRAGVFLGLYDAHAVGQYEWPGARVALFAPVAIVLLGATVRALWMATGRSMDTYRNGVSDSVRSIRMIDLLMTVGAVGALSIWPAKIGVLYAVALAVAVSALHRLDRALTPTPGSDSRLG